MISPTFAGEEYAGGVPLNLQIRDEFAIEGLQFPATTIIVGGWPVSVEEAYLDQAFVFRAVGCGDGLKRGFRQMILIKPACRRESALHHFRHSAFWAPQELRVRGFSTA